MMTKLLLFLFTTLAIVPINFRHDAKMKSYQDKGNEHQFECVGRLYLSQDLTYKGSCVLISPEHVLVAAHSLKGRKTKPDTKVETFNYEAKDLTIKVEGEQRGISMISLHPNHNDSIHKVDLAILELTNPIKSVEPATLNNAINELNGKISWGAGWGVIEAGDGKTQLPFDSIKLAGTNVIDSTYQHELYIDFDHPTTDTCCNEFGSPKALPMEFAPNGGDSGSGLFVESNEGWLLVGISSSSQYKMNMARIKRGIIHSYGSTHKYMSVFSQIDWINNVIDS